MCSGVRVFGGSLFLWRLVIGISINSFSTIFALCFLVFGVLYVLYICLLSYFRFIYLFYFGVAFVFLGLGFGVWEDCPEFFGFRV